MRTKMYLGLALALTVVVGSAQMFGQDNSGIDSDIQMLRADIR